MCRGFESRPDLQGRICPIVARSGNLLIYPKLTAGKDRPPGLSHARRLYGTVAQRVERLHYGLVHRLHRAVCRRFESGLSRQRVSASCNGYRLRQSGTGSCMSQHTIWVFPPAATGGGMVPYLNRQESAAHNHGHLGSTPSGTTNAKAMCGAWLGAYALPGRLDPANLM